MTLSPQAKKNWHAVVVGVSGALAYLSGALVSGQFPGWKVLWVGCLASAVSRLAGWALSAINETPAP